MGKPGPKATNIFQKLKLGNNSVKSMPKYSTSPVKKALKGDQDDLPMELQAAIKAAPGKKTNFVPKRANITGKPVGTPEGAEKRKQIIEKVRKEGEAKVSASAKKLKTPSPNKILGAVAGALGKAVVGKVASKVANKAVGKKHKSHAKKNKSMAYKFKSDAQRKAAYASGYKGK